MEQKVIYQIINSLIGKKVKLASRHENMLYMRFNDAGNECVMYVETSWRIIQEDRIICAYFDIYEPNSTTPWSKDFEWNIKGANLFDEKIVQWFGESSYIVERCELSEMNDLTICFNNGYKLEIFVDGSSEEECWRLFQSDSLVLSVSGMGVQWI